MQQIVRPRHLQFYSARSCILLVTITLGVEFTLWWEHFSKTFQLASSGSWTATTVTVAIWNREITCSLFSMRNSRETGRSLSELFTTWELSSQLGYISIISEFRRKHSNESVAGHNGIQCHDGLLHGNNRVLLLLNRLVFSVSMAALINMQSRSTNPKLSTLYWFSWCRWTTKSGFIRSVNLERSDATKKLQKQLFYILVVQVLDFNFAYFRNCHFRWSSRCCSCVFPVLVLSIFHCSVFRFRCFPISFPPLWPSSHWWMR